MRNKKMKTIIALLFTILLLSNCITQPVSINTQTGTTPAAAPIEIEKKTIEVTEPELSANTDTRIVGKWIIDNPEMTGFGFEFFSDKTVNWIMGEEIVTGTYTISIDSDPIVLRMNVPNQGDIITIINFISDDILQMQNNMLGEPQPAGFTEDSEILLRVQI